MFKEYVKLGFGFYIGYELAAALDDVLGQVITLLKQTKK